MIGQTVGNYKILHALGEGGVGMVYKGVDTMLDREVAVKVLRPELASQTSVVERFRSEAVTLAKLSHPNIATLFSLFRHGTDLIMVMEFVRGESLETIIQKRGRVSAADAIPIFCQALDGINHAHEVGIIHRDIKPSNMILTETGTLKVLDFGIARLLGSSRMTRVGNIIGTLEYMSPEQVRGEDTDARSDIYALGMMLYEVLTGKLPFESENEFVLMKMQTEQMPVPPRQINPEIPIAIEAAIMRAVAKNPRDRFQNAGDFLQTLLAVDLPFTGVQQFGAASLYQAKLRTRPSNPGLRQTEPLPRESAQTNPTNQPTEILRNVPIPDSPPAAPTAQLTEILGNNRFTEDETKKFALEKAEDGALAFDKAEIEPVNPLKETRIGQADKTLPPPVFKETRLGAGGNQQFVQPGLKATRLGAVETAAGDFSSEKPASFFGGLTWIHYAGAGAAAFILLSVVGLAAVGTFIYSSQAGKPAANQTTVEKESKAETETEIKTTKSVEKTTPPDVYAPPVSSSNTADFGEPLVPIVTGAEPPKKIEDAPKDTKAQKPSEAKKTAPKETTPTDSSASPPKTRTTPPKSPPSPRPNPPRAGPTPDLTDN